MSVKVAGAVPSRRPNRLPNLPLFLRVPHSDVTAHLLFAELNKNAALSIPDKTYLQLYVVQSQWIAELCVLSAGFMLMSFLTFAQSRKRGFI